MFQTLVFLGLIATCIIALVRFAMGLPIGEVVIIGLILMLWIQTLEVERKIDVLSELRINIRPDRN